MAFLLPGMLACLSLSATAASNGTASPKSTGAAISSPARAQIQSNVSANTPLPSIPSTPQTASPLVPEYVVIRSSEEITFSSEISASVMNENVDEGSTFNTGDILLQLDCRVEQADLQKSMAQQQLSRVAMESATKLKSFNTISNFEYAQAMAQLQSANADVQKLSAIVEKCMVKAPFSGSVARIMVHKGETVKPGDPLLKIVNTKDLDFEMQVPSSWLKWLHVGSTASVHINELNRNVPVTVVRIYPEIDSVSQTVRITGKATALVPSLLPGMSGQARFRDNP